MNRTNPCTGLGIILSILYIPVKKRCDGQGFGSPATT
jgi:hypothetical protein